MRIHIYGICNTHVYVGILEVRRVGPFSELAYVPVTRNGARIDSPAERAREALGEPVVWIWRLLIVFKINK